MTALLCCVLNCLFVGLSAGRRLGKPDYTSVWTLMTAQSVDRSTLDFSHNLGEVPGLVEVLVTPKDGDYEGFVFKATGNGGIDDDSSVKYGGVVYLYDDVMVTVIVPKRNNQQLSGYALNTGESSYWTGGSFSTSLDVYVKVRCWLPSNMPSPCFQADDINVQSGSSSSYPTFIELNHGAENLPEMVIVRTQLTDGRNTGMYSDGQGTNRFISSSHSRSQGGIVFGFNLQTVRIWISSTDGNAGYIYNTVDGWGLESSSTSGVLDVRVWCDMNLTVIVEDSLNVGPEVQNEQLTMNFSIQDNVPSDVFVSILFQAQGGPNDGYFFQGIDSAMSVSSSSDSSCHYGGLIYSYNMQSINFRRPSRSNGAIICIGDINSDGMYTGPIENGIASVKVWRLDSILGKIILDKYRLYQNNSGVDYPYIGIIRAQTLKFCLFECSKTNACEAVKYDQTQSLCSMFNFVQSDNIINEPGSDIWIVTG